MKDVILNIGTGALCRVNFTIAAVGLTGTLTLKEWAQIFAGVATGLWFTAQLGFLLYDRAKKRKKSQ